MNKPPLQESTLVCVITLYVFIADRTGPNCELLRDGCLNNPCLNDGTCSHDPDNGLGFSCACTPGRSLILGSFALSESEYFSLIFVSAQCEH